MSSGADLAGEPERRFRVNVPSIAHTEVTAAVAARRDLFPPASQVPSGSTRSAAQIAAIRRALDDIEARIANITRRCAPRSELPRRLAPVRFASVPILAAYNYCTKAQRETTLEQTAAFTSLVAVLRFAIGVDDE